MMQEQTMEDTVPDLIPKHTRAKSLCLSACTISRTGYGPEQILPSIA